MKDQFSSPLERELFGYDEGTNVVKLPFCRNDSGVFLPNPEVLYTGTTTVPPEWDIGEKHLFLAELTNVGDSDGRHNCQDVQIVASATPPHTQGPHGQLGTPIILAAYGSAAYLEWTDEDELFARDEEVRGWGHSATSASVSIKFGGDGKPGDNIGNIQFLDPKDQSPLATVPIRFSVPYKHVPYKSE